MRKDTTVVDRQTAATQEGGVIDLWGDEGGHIWVTAKAAIVEASDGVLLQLAVDLGGFFDWSQPEMNGVTWLIAPPWHEWGWAIANDEHDVYVRSNLVQRGATRTAVLSVLTGHADRLLPA